MYRVRPNEKGFILICLPYYFKLVLFETGLLVKRAEHGVDDWVEKVIVLIYTSGHRLVIGVHYDIVEGLVPAKHYPPIQVGWLSARRQSD